MRISEYKKLSHKKNKYGAIRQKVDGIIFASKAEATRYLELMLLQKSGKIHGLRLQTNWPLFACCEDGKKGLIKTLIGYYRDDFSYFDSETGALIVEDKKGFATDLFKWKFKHVQAQYPGVTFKILK